MTTTPEPPPEPEIVTGGRARRPEPAAPAASAPARAGRRPGPAVGLIGAGLLRRRAHAARHRRDAASDAALLQRGQELFNENVLHQLPRLQPAGRRGPRPEPDRRRRRRRVLPGLQRADAAGAPGAQAKRKPPLPIFDPDTEEGQANLDALGAYIQANGGGPTRPEARGEQRCAATTRRAAASCSGSTAPRATTSPAAAARCPRASTPRTWTRPPRRRSTRRC